MKRVLSAGAAALVLAAAPAAVLAATITVVPTVAPNVFGSPSFLGWQSNAVDGLYSGASTFGAPGLPTYYAEQSNVRADQVIVTGFASWLGQVDPGTAFGPAFANEYGNRMHFGVVIDGDGTQFSIDQLAFDAHSSDPGDILAFSFGAGSYGYSNAYVGVLFGADGQFGGGDDTFITSGPANQLVDGLVGRGSGNSIPAYCPGCTPAQQQAAIQGAVDQLGRTATFTGTYTLGADSGSGTFNIVVPEPATWAMMIVGAGLVGAAARRRPRRFTAPT